MSVLIPVAYLQFTKVWAQKWMHTISVLLIFTCLLFLLWISCAFVNLCFSLFLILTASHLSHSLFLLLTVLILHSSLNILCAVVFRQNIFFCHSNRLYLLLTSVILIWLWLPCLSTFSSFSYFGKVPITSLFLSLHDFISVTIFLPSFFSHSSLFPLSFYLFQNVCHHLLKDLKILSTSFSIPDFYSAEKIKKE